MKFFVHLAIFAVLVNAAYATNYYLGASVVGIGFAWAYSHKES